MSVQYKVLETVKQAHDEEIWDVVWLNEDDVMTGSLDDKVRIWKYNNENNSISQLGTLSNHNLGVNSVDVSNSLGIIATRSLDSFIRFYSTLDYEQVRQLDCSPTSSWTIKFFPNGKFIATGSMTGHVHIIRANDAEQALTLDTRSNFVVGIAISPDGRLLATSGMDGRVVIFEITETELEIEDENSKLELEKEKAQKMFDADEMKIDEEKNENDLISGLTGNDKNTPAHLINKSNTNNEEIIKKTETKLLGKIKFEFEAHAKPVRALCFTSNSKNIITGADDQLIRVHNLEGEKRTLLDTMCGHGGWILCLRRSPDKRHIVSTSTDGKIKIWDLLQRECIHTFDQHHGHKCWAASYNSDGSKLASVSSDKTLVVYECPKAAI